MRRWGLAAAGMSLAIGLNFTAHDLLGAMSVATTDGAAGLLVGLLVAAAAGKAWVGYCVACELRDG